MNRDRKNVIVDRRLIEFLQGGLLRLNYRNCLAVSYHKGVQMTKDILLDQFIQCYDTNGWFVATKNAIAGINAQQAAWKPEGADNSIHEIINHLNYYNN